MRLLTVTGAAGSGKTRLALELAKRELPRFRDGVFFCELAPITEPDGVLAAIARVLELRGGGRKSLLDQIKAAVAERRLLLVLDNLEQVLDVSPALAELLASCPHVRLLGTSRAPLHLSAEHEYPLGPLAEDDAAELFRLRATAVRPDFSADGEVDEICRHLDWLPLAIELAAARVRILPTRALLERLEHHQSMALLTGGARDLPERQRSLRTTLEWSHGLLDPAEQQLFARLAVFAGGFTLEAAEAVCSADLDLLAALLDQSLLVDRDEHGTARFSMLETVREFALEQLELAGEADSVKERHAERFSAEALGLTVELRTGEPWVNAAVTTELENFRSAFEWSLENDRPELAHRILYALQFYFGTHATLREGCDWARRLEEAGGELSAARRGPRAPCGKPAEPLKRRHRIGRASEPRGPWLCPTGWGRSSARRGVAKRRPDRSRTRRDRYGTELGGGSTTALAGKGQSDWDRPLATGASWDRIAAGRYKRVRELLSAGIPVFETESKLDLIQALTLLGAVASREGRRDDARVELQRAAQLCAEIEGGGDDLSDILIELAAVEADSAAENAATFLGYAERAWDTMGFPPWRLLDVEDLSFALRQRLGEKRYEAAVRRGQRLAFNQVLELALSAGTEGAAPPGQGPMARNYEQPRTPLFARPKDVGLPPTGRCTRPTTATTGS